jgi:hypothetical protein
MKIETKIAYVVHPVTAEQKADLRAHGYRIVDARFAPEDVEIISFDEKPDFTPEGIDKMNKKDLSELLEMHGDTDGGKVPEMRERLKRVMFVNQLD